MDQIMCYVIFPSEMIFKYRFRSLTRGLIQCTIVLNMILTTDRCHVLYALCQWSVTLLIGFHWIGVRHILFWVWLVFYRFFKLKSVDHGSVRFRSMWKQLLLCHLKVVTREFTMNKCMWPGQDQHSDCPESSSSAQLEIQLGMEFDQFVE